MAVRRATVQRPCKVTLIMNDKRRTVTLKAGENVIL